MGVLMAQVFGQPSIGRMAKAPIQQAIQGCFQPPRGLRRSKLVETERIIASNTGTTSEVSSLFELPAQTNVCANRNQANDGRTVVCS